MLVIQVQEKEKIQIGDAVVEVRMRAGKPVLYIKAPRDMQVCRETAKNKEPREATNEQKGS